MSTPDQHPPLTADEQDFVSPPPSAEEITEAERDVQSADQDVLQNFVVLGKRYGFETRLVAHYIRHQEIALATWADDTQRRNKDDLAFCVVAYLIAKKPDTIVKHRLGARAAAVWFARPKVQELLAEIGAGRDAIEAHKQAVTDKIAEVIGFPGAQPESPNVREWLAGGRKDDTLLTSPEERLEAAEWF